MDLFSCAATCYWVFLSTNFGASGSCPLFFLRFPGLLVPFRGDLDRFFGDFDLRDFFLGDLFLGLFDFERPLEGDLDFFGESFLDARSGDGLGLDLIGDFGFLMAAGSLNAVGGGFEFYD
jgi:hypothetical protein